MRDGQDCRAFFIVNALIGLGGEDCFFSPRGFRLLLDLLLPQPRFRFDAMLQDPDNGQAHRGKDQHETDAAILEQRDRMHRRTDEESRIRPAGPQHPSTTNIGACPRFRR